MKKKLIGIILFAFMLGFSLTGCKSQGDADDETVIYQGQTDETGNGSNGTDGSTDEQNGTQTDTAVEPQDPSNSTDDGEEDTPILNENGNLVINFSIINLCGVDIGMISTIDPFTGEQIDVGELPADNVLTINMEWPVENTIFDMAIYNSLGDLVSTSEIDITGVKSNVMITLSGNNDLEHVDTTID